MADHGFAPDDDAPLFVISVAAQLAGMHAQTLRQYDRLGLVTPQRAGGGGRRYSARDVAQLRQIQRLSQEEGVSLAGIRQILALQRKVADLSDRLESVVEEVEALRAQVHYGQRVFAAGVAGEVVAVRAGQRPRRRRATGQDLMVWRPSTPLRSITGRAITG
ncbi:helix-turn-helix transcriptional regulator [Arsenicicoccus piscis]|uniref:Transcriptional regulator n=1 Tax=Arsenicicoccus piscis TaxID=673954 RepID=A0ABQ6HRD3_9MICO|nr:helix-turn-helix transcriptional regulator [Arsenicicoccus piscis]MCH8626284.1 helix-turn-helix transcriptional regulator [Arsenicicoccus piscis]GMA20881.1 transcriptional regulator [Arsenicicoccus piscis]